MFGSLENWGVANACPELKQGHLEAILFHSLNNLATQRHGRGWRTGDWTSDQALSVSNRAVPHPRKSDVPKLFINADPGAILVGRQRKFCRTWPNQTEVTVKGLHFIQEDRPDEIGEAIADFVRRLR